MDYMHILNTLAFPVGGMLLMYVAVWTMSILYARDLRNMGRLQVFVAGIQIAILGGIFFSHLAKFMMSWARIFPTHHSEIAWAWFALGVIAGLVPAIVSLVTWPRTRTN